MISDLLLYDDTALITRHTWIPARSENADTPTAVAAPQNVKSELNSDVHTSSNCGMYVLLFLKFLWTLLAYQ